MQKKRIHLVALAVLVVLGSPRVLADSVDDYVRQQMKEKHIPGAVLVALKDGKTLKQVAYGVADVELNVPMHVDDVFLVASITKVFVTAAVLLLVGNGKLHLDDKVTQIIPGLPYSWRDVTRSIASAITAVFRISCDTGPVDSSGWQVLRRNR